MSKDINFKNKKILLFITKSNFGGAQRYVYNLASELDKKGVKIKVIFGDKGVLARKLEQEGIETVSVPYLQRDINFFKEFLVLFKLIGIFYREKPDILHLNSSKAAGLGIIAVKVNNLVRRINSFFRKEKYFRISTVFTSHGWAFNEPRNLLSKRLMAFVYWIIILGCDITISVSHAAKKQVSHYPFIRNKIEVVHNGIVSIEFREKQEARQLLAEKDLLLKNKIDSTKKDLFWIGTISEFHPIKGLPVAVDAISELLKKYPNILFLIMGADGNEKERLQKKIKTMNLEENVFILGFVEHASAYIKAFDVFTLTSYSECFPYAILEVGLAGVPIVASDVGGIPEAITDNITGKLTTPGDFQSVADAILDLIEHEKERKELAVSMKGRVERRFSIEKMFNETLKVYKQIL